MKNALKQLAYRIDAALPAKGISLTRSQVREAAALLGYSSIAAMIADPNFADLESCFALVFDRQRAVTRLQGFPHKNMLLKKVSRFARLYLLPICDIFILFSAWCKVPLKVNFSGTSRSSPHAQVPGIAFGAKAIDCLKRD